MKKILLACMLISLYLGVNAQSDFIHKNINDEVACRRWVDNKLQSMTLKQKIGQLFIHTVAPYTTQSNKQNISDAVKGYGIGGLLFSSGEIGKQIELTNYAQSMAEIPLLITFDGEWGLAMRLKGTPSFPRNRVLGCIQNDTLLYEYGKEVARQLREIGVHVNFAPVADIDNNPKNPVINTRSFGSDRENVARKVVAYSRGLQDGGVLAVCKHFPGHGDTEVDSHKSLPVLPFTRERLDSIELYPFRKAIEAGVGGMMVGHLNVTSLDNKAASVSHAVVTELLKNELHFSGLVFTDALEMKGISSNPYVSAQALIAGNDMVLAPRNLKRELDGVLKAVKEGKITEDEINEKCRKVLTYKYAFGLDRRPVVAKEGVMARINKSYTNDLMNRIKTSAVTVIKDSDEMLPLDLSLSGTVVLNVSSTLSETYPFYNQINDTYPVTWLHANLDSLQYLKKKITPAQRIIVAVYTSKVDKYKKVLAELAKGKPTILICFNSHKVLQKLDDVVAQSSAVVLAHSDDKPVQKFVAEMLLGNKRVDGRLSVDYNDEYKAGLGVVVDPDKPRRYKPEEFGMDSKGLARIDSIAMYGIENGAYPGCHVLVWKNGYPVYNKCFGTHTYESDRKVKENDLYDLASLTKTTATMLAVMKLYDDGKLNLTDKISNYVPEMKSTNKENITIQELLYHESGLPAYLPFYKKAIDTKSCKGGMYKKYKDANHSVKVANNLYICTNYSFLSEWVSDKETSEYSLKVSDNMYIKPEFKSVILKEIADTPLKGHSYRYSCLNFMLLKEAVENISGMPMDEFLEENFYKPMGLVHTMYNPLKRYSKDEIIPTVKEDFLRKGPVHGYVHDEAAAMLGGVSGNAGLFSTAKEVATIYQMLLDKGVMGDRRYLTRATCELFLTMKSKNSRRGLGFDKPDKEKPENGYCAPETPASVFGHTGFTGTCAWADPDNDLVFVFLCNRIYPNPCDRKNLMKLKIRPAIQQAIYQAIMK
ncbi:serine hydrolase [Bacteroides caecigallinarum]|uniref:glycoside hydrolase family 3 N-terminal domain-containing protein n=1 Tax=Bacteroides caecigallinarum TaxID=1411144 RepID=UPI00195EDC57|nr:glycoside hydrolase family 3 N-terminal domain-containing protein [Bacteroides caecigallinarum]MBM6863980.1 serine hydrolase [Bacteroides caecigallinarum]